MLSATAQYALQAVLFVAARHDDRPVPTREIAACTGAPEPYLARILRVAVRAGLLRSTRGLGGGFRLARPARSIRLCDVLAPFDEGPPRLHCPLDRPRCTPQAPCSLHAVWRPIEAAYRDLLKRTTLEEFDPTSSGSRRSHT